MIEVDALGFVYLVNVLRELTLRSNVYFVRPTCNTLNQNVVYSLISGFLIKTLRHEGIKIADYQVCETSMDAINRVELRLSAKNIVGITEESKTLDLTF